MNHSNTKQNSVLRLLLPLILLLLSACSEPMQSDQGNLTVSIATPSVGEVATLPAGVLISSAYPYLSSVTMQISGEGHTTASINSDYNGDRFTMVAGSDAFSIVDTTFSLNVPNDVELFFTITAYNLNGYRIYSASASLLPADLQSGSASLPVSMAVDIDTTVPVQTGDVGCSGDDDGDGLCNDYEEMFVRLDGVADVDSDGTPNSLDTDSDNDGVTDDLDWLAPSNDGYPSFIHANTAPTAVSLSLVTDKGVGVSGDAVVDDADVGDCHSIGIATQPANGTAAILAGGVIDPANPYACVFYGVSYTPNASFVGSDSFTITATDRAGATITGSVSVTVNGANDVPVADAQTVTTDEDTALAITLSGSDTETTTLSYAVATGPSNGVLTGTAPNLDYTPNANFNGADSFTFTVSDGIAVSTEATVSINVTAINDVPVADAQSATTNEDTAVAIILSGSDVDLNNLSYTVVTPPANGVLSGTAPNLSYTPNANYNGGDSFTFTVNDGTVDSVAATVTLTVNAVNDAPVADAQSVITDEDTAVAVTLTGSDVEGSGLSYAVTTNPANGVLSGTAPNLSYTPNANYNGSDSFTFTVNDGTVGSVAATVTLTVNAVNDVPVADAQSVTTDEDVAVAVTLTGSDVEGSGLSYTVATNPANGVLSGTAPNLTYTPSADYNGSDSFTFTVNDGTVDSVAATVALTITAINDAPVAVADSETVNEDTLLTTASVLTNDTDVDLDTLFVTTADTTSANGGTVVDNGDGTFDYTPATNFNGSDSFSYTVSDGTLTDIGTVTITVNAVNDAPVAAADTAVTVNYVGMIIDLLANDTDVDGDTLSINTVDSVGSNGGYVTDIGSGRVFYEPLNNLSGSDSFNYTIVDGNGGGVAGSVSITLNTDSDYDGLSDADEAGLGTNPALADHDGDGFVDGHEVAAGSDPLSNASTPAGTVISSADGSNVISGDVVWDLAGSPYWVRENVSVVSGGNLIIEPFVAVKYAVGTTTQFVYPGGTMRVFGAPGSASYVTFTSERDDTVQGDTNGDGPSTLPASGDWARVEFAGGDGEINYSNMRYGNTTLWIRDSSPDVLVLNANNCGAYCVYISSSDAGITTAPTLSSLFLETPATGAQHAISIVNNTGVNTLTPLISGFNTIDLLDTLDIGIYVTGVGAIPIVDSTGGSNPIEITGGGYGISVNNGAAGTFRGVEITQAATSGVRFNTTGAPALENSVLYLNGNLTSNGGGVEVTDAATGTAIDNNVIRANLALAGGGIYQASVNEFPIRNNLIIDNVAYLDAASAGGGIMLASGSVTALQHNTLSGNYTEANMGGGLYVGDSATVTMSDNILWGNFDMCDGACTGDVVVGTLVTVNSSYNLVGDSGTYTFTGTGDIYSDPLFVRNWYLDNVFATSPAIDPVGTATTLPSYLSALTTPTTVVDGTVDASGGDTVDMGFHHTAAAPLVDEAQSSVTSGTITGSPQTANIMVIPMDSAGQWLGAGLNVSVAFTANQGSSLTGGVVCDLYTGFGLNGSACPLRDNGDGTYEITYDNSTTWCTSACTDTLQITVNGTAFTTKTITYSW